MENFLASGLNPEILKALMEMGFEKPTPIQAKTIPHLLNSDRDLIAFAQTGTGKTAAFSLPIIEQIDPNERAIQAIILCPTRELCLQITRDIEAYTKYSVHLSVLAVYGGAHIMTQIKGLKDMPQIIVGTPGRVNDLIRRKKLNLQSIRWFVLDEADEMLNMGFKEEIDEVLADTPADKQTLLFSATMPVSMKTIVNKYMHDPLEITAGERNISAANLKHQYYVVSARDRYAALRRLADLNPDIYGIIFCRTRTETQEVADQLIQDHYNAEAIHGDLSQEQRDLVMNRFRKKQTQLLVATDVAARGIDVTDLTHVINYQLPTNAEIYVHRSGRTGRAGAKGIALSIITPNENYKIKNIERQIKQPITQEKIPSGAEICERQLFEMIQRITHSTADTKEIEPYLAKIEEQLAGLSREELVKRVVAMEFNRFLEFYRNAPDLNNLQGKGHGGGNRYEKESGRGQQSRGKGQEKRAAGGRRPTNATFSELEINLGKKDGFSVKNLFTLINSKSPVKGVEIGQINIQSGHTIFEIDRAHEQAFIKNFRPFNSRGKQVKVNKR